MYTPTVNMNESLKASKVGGIAIGTILGVIVTYSLVRTSMLQTKLAYTQLMKLKAEGYDYENPLSMENLFDKFEAEGEKIFGKDKGKTLGISATASTPTKTTSAPITNTMQANQTNADGGQTIKEYMMVEPNDCGLTFSCDGCPGTCGKKLSMIGDGNFFGGVEEEYVQRQSVMTGRPQNGTSYWKPAGLTPAHNWGTSYE